jgi:thiol-disulfide isomerase/thioredoxin
MRFSVPLLCLALIVPATAQNAQDCEPSASASTILEQLQLPENVHLPSVERQNLKLALLRKAIAANPSDLFLHEAYQDTLLAGRDYNRNALIVEYEQLASTHPRDPVFLYLAARAQSDGRAQEAIGNLEQAIALAPGFAQPELLLAQIESSNAARDNAGMKLHLTRFTAICPASVRTVPALRWSDDKVLLKSEAARLRRNIEGRSDFEAVRAYPTLWQFEAALERSDHQDDNQARMRADVDGLFAAQFARNAAWLEAIQATNFMDGAPKDAAHRASLEIAALYPDSDAAVGEESRKALAGHELPEQTAENQRWKWHTLLPLVRKWPNVEWLAFQEANAVLEDHAATPEEVNEVMDLLLNAARQDPCGYPTMPPVSIILSQKIIDRGGPYERVPELTAAGFVEMDRLLASNSPDGREDAARTRLRSFLSLFGSLPLIEADLRLGRISSAGSALAQAETRLQTIRPSDNAGSEEKTRFRGVAAPYWFLRGEYAEKEGRKIDALVDYRNALSLYPPRGLQPDRRDEAMASAERLWKGLGGSTQGWNDWAAESSLAGFYTGSGGAEAWLKFADSSPDLILTDTMGNNWNPRDLAKKTTFVTMWASWCGPCLAELPYLEKLYQQFKGRDDVAILAFNVDDDPSAMKKALQKVHVSIPSIAAGEFAYSIVPAMAIPANWIITPGKTEIFQEDGNSLDDWRKNAAAAIEKAAKK